MEEREWEGGEGTGPSAELGDRTVCCISLAPQQKELITRFHLLLHFCTWVEFITSFKLHPNFKNDGCFPWRDGLHCLKQSTPVSHPNREGTTKKLHKGLVTVSQLGFHSSFAN